MSAKSCLHFSEFSSASSLVQVSVVAHFSKRWPGWDSERKRADSVKPHDQVQSAGGPGSPSPPDCLWDT